MIIDPAEKKPREIYSLLISTITPRPIAWVSSMSADSRTNLAPYSFFNGVTAAPPTIVFSPVNDRHGNKKDTVRNIEATGEFVVNIVSEELAEAMNATSAEFEYGVSEFERCGVPSVPSQRVGPPGVAGAAVRFECVLHQIVPVGEGPLASMLTIGRVVLFHVADEVMRDGQVDPTLLRTIGRMGGSLYTRTRDLFDIQRPAGPAAG